MINGNVSLTVLVHGHNAGRTAREYVSPMDRNTYIEGRRGSNFTLRIENRSYQRVLAVPSVDGLSVLDGKPAGSKSPGFILEALGSVDIPGWKVDGGVAAKFFFAGDTGAGDRSYVGQIGADEVNRGVIGVLVFAEVPRHPVHRPAQSFGMSKGAGSVLRSAPMAASASSAGGDAPLAAQAQSLGTGFGEATEFRTVAAEFARGAVIASMSIYYDDERGLKRKGIDISKAVAPVPNAFPADQGGCAVPPGWVR